MSARPQHGFQRWIARFRPRALAQGITPATFDRAFAGASYDAAAIAHDRNQSEFTKPIWTYLDSAVSPARVQNGRVALRRNRALLTRIERTYGVSAEVVTAIWGLESAYGANRGNTPLISSLATLAYEGRRGKFFEAQLIAALKILQAGDVTPAKLVGSWAGGMGHTQFIPTTYLAYAVDFTGDDKRDIWSDNPADALASTASYLAYSGWKTGQPWGMEVTLPKGFDYGLAGTRTHKSAARWSALGVRTVHGRQIPDHGPASILLPAGARGPAFVIFHNFHVIERYNTAEAYVIAVGHLADRISGDGPFRAQWPRDEHALSFSEKQELQKRLSANGFTTHGADGIIGPNTIQAIRRYQTSVGLLPDGYASFDILKRLR